MAKVSPGEDRLVSQDTITKWFDDMNDAAKEQVRGHGPASLAEQLGSDVTNGLSSESREKNQEKFGRNEVEVKKTKGYCMLVWEALHDLTEQSLAKIEALTREVRPPPTHASAYTRASPRRWHPLCGIPYLMCKSALCPWSCARARCIAWVEAASAQLWPACSGGLETECWWAGAAGAPRSPCICGTSPHLGYAAHDKSSRCFKLPFC